jgi:hypothetical protein
MLIVIGWLAFTIIVAVAANTRGRNALGWGILAALFSPLLMGLLLLALPNRRMEALMFGDATPSGPLRTPEWLEQRARRRNIVRATVLALLAAVMIFKLVGWVVQQPAWNNDMPSAVAKTGDTLVVKTIEENGKPVQNAAIKKTR